jgi:protein tyrosine phosphatase (PTP) superfamily phosphohydrolase (DUF442 family)
LIEAAAAGYSMIINNRPDSELLALNINTQLPTSDIMQRAANSLGLLYVHLPITPGAAAAAAPQLSRILGGKQKV